MENLKTFENFYNAFEYFIETVVLLKDENYFRSNNSQQQEKIKDFFEIYCPDCSDSSELMELIDDFRIIQNFSGYPKKKDNQFYKLVGFYEHVINFMKTEKLKGPIISKNFLSNVDHLIHGKTVIHHSHIAGDVIGYAHSFCNLKVRENKNQVSVIAHNLFGFDFIFFLQGLRLGALNLSNINFANISDQVKFIYMYKYYQQSLSVLASTMNNEERCSVRKNVKSL